MPTYKLILVLFIPYLIFQSADLGLGAPSATVLVSLEVQSATSSRQHVCPGRTNNKGRHAKLVVGLPVGPILQHSYLAWRREGEESLQEDRDILNCRP